MEADLHVEERGNPEDPTIIFLHGLLGSSRNWRSVSKCLSNQYHTLCFDLPNHGKSFQQEESTVQKMADTLWSEINRRGISHFSLCGHSLGGKIAMRMACDHSGSVNQLVVVDIALRDYPPEHHLPTLQALLSLDISSFSSRKEADEALSEQIPNWAFRQFLLTNLELKDNRLCWLPDLGVLKDSIGNLSSNPMNSDDRFDGQTLFLCGGKSGYVRGEHHTSIREYFPSAEMITLPHAGHDVHVEDREGFLTHLQNFLQKGA
jgi:pimeloyl-ACP methyl ester carboxylesterase